MLTGVLAVRQPAGRWYHQADQAAGHGHRIRLSEAELRRSCGCDCRDAQRRGCHLLYVCLVHPYVSVDGNSV